eukprot:TRINITY_DN9655_c0_g1_i2.p2 TRINITY_DN9655_c0_g1~~TRINITY_DN9655_c0_g1_i2.p2  ORF type:complete len:245 (+),score=44.98 TRINITY_DN9655_c0_g1_i2:72-737(+)
MCIRDRAKGRTIPEEHFVETTKNFSLNGQNRESYDNTAIVRALHKVRTVIDHGKTLPFAIDVCRDDNYMEKDDDNDDTNITVVENCFGGLLSSYSIVYRGIEEDYIDPVTKKNTLLRKCIDRTAKNTISGKGDDVFLTKEQTLETPISHISGDSLSTVDYIWIDKESFLEPFGVLETLDYATVENHKWCFPNKYFGSDHVSIAVDFRYSYQRIFYIPTQRI